LITVPPESSVNFSFNSNWFDYSNGRKRRSRPTKRVSIPTGSITVRDEWMFICYPPPVSIPTGSITVYLWSSKKKKPLAFQFQLVRLQSFSVNEAGKVTFCFNSNWFDYSKKGVTTKIKMV